MKNSFYALIARMRNITRWGLMRNSFVENVQEHSHMVAVLAHALAVIRRDVLGAGASNSPDPCFVATAALYHDSSEIFTGDLPSPIKYLNPEIMAAYKDVESKASQKLLQMLPEEMRPAYCPLLSEEDDEVHSLIKAADKLSAYIKCIEEEKAGNREFSSAKEQLERNLLAMEMPEVTYFLDNFIPSFGLSLDDISLD